MSGASIVNFEHISQVIVELILLNLDKLMTVGPQKRKFLTINLFSITMRNTLFYGL